MNKDNDFIEQIRDYFQHHQNQFGWVLAAVGLFFFIGTLLNWDWLLEGDGRAYNIAWFSQTFGRKAARILFGVFSLGFIVLGIAWVFVF